MENNKNKQSKNYDRPNISREDEFYAAQELRKNEFIEKFKDSDAIKEQYRFNEWTEKLWEISTYSRESPSLDIELDTPLDIHIPLDTKNETQVKKQANFIKVEGNRGYNLPGKFLIFTLWDELPEDEDDIFAIPEAVIKVDFEEADEYRQSRYMPEEESALIRANTKVWASGMAEYFDPDEMIEVSNLPKEIEDFTTILSSEYTDSLDERLEDLQTMSNKRLGRSVLRFIEIVSTGHDIGPKDVE